MTSKGFLYRSPVSWYDDLGLPILYERSVLSIHHSESLCHPELCNVAC